MKVVVAIDSLKGSLTSLEAGEAIKQGILCANSQIEVVVKPLADGGEGTTEALVNGMGGEFVTLDVTGPIGNKVQATYGILPDRRTVVMEIAQACGLPLVPTEKRNPLYTTTYGVGEIIKACIQKGYRKFIVGIGGSATNDAGIGMLQALGYRFLDDKNKEVTLGGQALEKIRTIDDTYKIQELETCEFKIACDVNNPLYGSNGAAAIYAPQKGATPEIVVQLDHGLINFAQVVHSYTEKDFSEVEGAGAAGGLGFALIAFLKGQLKSGVELVLQETKLEDSIREADLVVTGEGRLDNQTAMGKAPIGVAKLAKEYNLPVIGIAGGLAKEVEQCNEEGIDAYFSIINRPISLDDAMKYENARENMMKTTEQLFRLIEVVKPLC